MHLRGHDNTLKRLLIHAGGLNLGLLMRQLFGIGTPRSLQGRALALLRCIWSLIRLPETLWNLNRLSTPLGDSLAPHRERPLHLPPRTVFTTGC